MSFCVFVLRQFLLSRLHFSPAGARYNHHPFPRVGPAFSAVVVVVGCVIWGLLLASSAWVDAQVAAAFDAIPNPSPEQIREFSADGATKSMLFLFGLPFSLCYTVAWFVIVRVGRRFGRRLF